MLLRIWETLTLSGGHMVGMQDARLESHETLRPSQIVDLRLAASKMTGATRRAFQAEMAWKYCGGNPLLAETIFGWGRHTVEVGLAERRTGIRCLGSAIGLQRSQTLGSHAARGSGSPLAPGGSIRATRPNVP